MALPRRPIRRCLRLRAYRHSAVDGRAKSTFASFVIKNILRRERVFRTGGGMSAPDMQWEGFSGWNGLLGIWGLEPEWTARDRGEAARGRATGKGCSEWEQGVRGGGEAQSGSGTLGIGTGRSEWGQGAPSGDGDSLGGRGKSCSRGRLRNVRSFGASRARGMMGESFGKGAEPSVIYCTGLPLPSSRRSV